MFRDLAGSDCPCEGICGLCHGSAPNQRVTGGGSLVSGITAFMRGIPVSYTMFLCHVMHIVATLEQGSSGNPEFPDIRNDLASYMIPGIYISACLWIKL
jgi:hypothetical protein